MAVGLNAGGDTITRSQVIGGVGISGLTICGWFNLRTALASTDIWRVRNAGNGRYITMEVAVPAATPELRFGDSQTGLTSFAAQPSPSTWLFGALSCTAVGAGDTITAYWSAEGSSTFNSGSRANGVEDSVSNTIVEVLGSAANGVWHEQFRAYNSALSQATLEGIKTASAPAGTEVFYWPLLDNTDTSDATGNGRTPTFAGTITTETGPSLGSTAFMTLAGPRFSLAGARGLA